MITVYAELQTQLGPVALPLVICAVLTVILVVESLCRLVSAAWVSRLRDESLTVLSNHDGVDAAAQEKALTLWLTAQAKRLHRGERLLGLIAAVAPILGLLGTVLGLMQAFNDIGLVAGPIEPSVLAAGLGVAMKTTAVGLSIALPALVFAQLQHMAADRVIEDTQNALNQAIALGRRAPKSFAPDNREVPA
jgi:biopolymer transport protein ExbB